MDQSLNYADILTQVIRAEGKLQPAFIRVNIIPVCDATTGQFLLLAVGWDKERHVDNILFHARLMDGLVVIETDNLEDGLRETLIEAGIRAEDIVLGWQIWRPKREAKAA